jgi:hypothetical protein
VKPRQSFDTASRAPGWRSTLNVLAIASRVTHGRKFLQLVVKGLNRLDSCG